MRNHLKLFASGAGCLAGAFLGSPFLFLDYRTALSDILTEARPTHLSATGGGLVQNVVWYLRGPLPAAIGTVGLILAAGGVLLCVFSDRREDKILLSFPVIFLLFISSLSLRWGRWIIPAVPFLCILAAYGLYRAAQWIAASVHPLTGSVAALLLLAVLSIPLGEAVVAQGREMSGIDTRTLSRQWMIEDLPRGSSVVMEVYTPQLPKTMFRYFRESNGELVEWDPQTTEHETFRPGGHIGRMDDIGDVWIAGVEYAVLSNMQDRYVAEEFRYPEAVRAYEKLIAGSSLIYEVESVPGTNRGPRIRIYEIRSSVDTHDAQTTPTPTLGGDCE